MEFKYESRNSVDKAFEAIHFLDESFKNGRVMEIQNFGQIIDLLEETIQDYQLALSQLRINNIEH